MISILVYAPDFACSENLVSAFGQRDDVQLISLNQAKHTWRELDAGLLVTDENLIEATEIVESSDLTVLGDATSLQTLEAVSPVDDWLGWSKSINLIAFFGDTAYFNNSDKYDEFCSETEARLFLLPNLVPLCSIDSIPLHHPMRPIDGNKSERVSIMHSPGYANKRKQKGTKAIEKLLRKLAIDFEFEYTRIEKMSLAECLALKATAHIFVDQLPPVGLPRGLGRSGLEGLAAGCATVSTMYPKEIVESYFDSPPVLAIESEHDLLQTARFLLESKDERIKRQGASKEWVANTIDFSPWIQYVERYL